MGNPVRCPRLFTSKLVRLTPTHARAKNSSTHDPSNRIESPHNPACTHCPPAIQQRKRAAKKRQAMQYPLKMPCHAMPPGSSQRPHQDKSKNKGKPFKRHTLPIHSSLLPHTPQLLDVAPAPPSPRPPPANVVHIRPVEPRATPAPRVHIRGVLLLPRARPSTTPRPYGHPVRPKRAHLPATRLPSAAHNLQSGKRRSAAAAAPTSAWSNVLLARAAALAGLALAPAGHSF
jgi:hypothetical protein